MNIVFSKKSSTVIITELANGDKRACGETLEDVASVGRRRQVGGQGDLYRLGCLHNFTISSDDIRTFGGESMMGARRAVGLGDEVIGGTGVGDATGGRRRRWWDYNFR